MTTPDLTPAHRKALTKVLDGDLWHRFLSFDELSALIALRDACPERPALEDGIYESPDEDGDLRPRYVRDGHYSTFRRPDGTPDGTLVYSRPLPDDVSGWRRIDGPSTVTPEQIEEAAREVAGYCEETWAALPEGRMDHYRARAGKILAAARVVIEP